MSAAKDVIKKFASKNSKSAPRIGWPNWISSCSSDRWYAWKIVVLLLLTNSVHDKIVRQIVDDLFLRYPNPLLVTKQSAAFLDFVTSKAKKFVPLSPGFDPMKDSITKGPDFCNQKAKNILHMTKVVILWWLVDNIASIKALNVDSLSNKYCLSMMESLLQPLPDTWLNEVEQSGAVLFPATYNHHFFGIGLKMRNLCAEAIYHINIGPAIDCHCIRYGVEFGIVHASMSQEHMSQIMCQDFHC